MSHHASIEATCPCCGAKVAVDVRLGKATHSEATQSPSVERDLSHASQLLERDAARRDSLFMKSMEAEKSKSDLLERKFEEALKKRGSDPVAPPVRDIDLD